jgi:hypothetical protein
VASPRFFFSVFRRSIFYLVYNNGIRRKSDARSQDPVDSTDGANDGRRSCLLVPMNEGKMNKVVGARRALDRDN